MILGHIPLVILVHSEVLLENLLHMSDLLIHGLGLQAHHWFAIRQQLDIPHLLSQVLPRLDSIDEAKFVVQSLSSKLEGNCRLCLTKECGEIKKRDGQGLGTLADAFDRVATDLLSTVLVEGILQEEELEGLSVKDDHLVSIVKRPLLEAFDLLHEGIALVAVIKLVLSMR